VTNTDSTLGPVVSDAVRAGLLESSIISLVSPASVASALRRMERAPTSRLDLALARELAQREGIKAVVDGNLTGVGGGYILTLRLVTADSAAELASFRETGDGPRGLIDAADKIARKLRSKIGESLRTVQTSPPLAQATTSSLEALRKFSAAQRANSIEGRFPRAVALAREAVTIDSTFAGAWAFLAQAMSNAQMPRALQDSAHERAYQYKDRLPERERLTTIAAYYMSGPHRDRTKAIAAYEALLQNDDRASSNNLGLVYSWSGEYARAESLHLRDMRRDSSLMLPYANGADAQLNQGKIQQAEATLTTAQRRFPGNVHILRRIPALKYAQGKLAEVERDVDSLRVNPDPAVRAYALEYKSALARLHGRYAESVRWDRELYAADSAQGGSRIAATDSLNALFLDARFHGPSDRLIAAIDATLTRLPLKRIAAIDRPDFVAARAYALAGRPDKAHVVLEQYQREVTDTAIVRLRQPDFHVALGEIALAEHKPTVAAAEFRRGEIGATATSRAADCGAVCLLFDLGRAFDHAEMSDSAIAMYERYLTTPHSRRLLTVDHYALASTHKRIGELYEAKGERQKAVAHYQQFVDLWKNADAEFQPRVTEVKRRLARLADTEKR